ncbi:ABC-type transport auxiliary lipoprotein family protein [Vreelandella utahensis]|uniref:ABC-type transport auxiliary lipoprotein family protein n=1 Tax=Vreelandella halophila TaxID=86177 RepID=UPI0009861B2A|nr:ABC-type transport auxiliary lipoprotein family protein [Halomonas utahensis]
MRHTARLPARLLTLLALTLVGACSILPEPNRYELYRLPPSSLGEQGTVSGATTLEIQAPRADDLTSSNRVVVLREGQRLSAWSGIRWTAPAPELWRDQLLDAFHNTGAFHALGIRDDNLNADLTLNGHLRAFLVDQTGPTPKAVIRFDAQLLDRREEGARATRRFEVAEPLAENSPTAAARAMGTATDRMAEQLLDWMAKER